MTRREVVFLILKSIVAWLLMSLSIWYFSADIANVIIPWLKEIIVWLMPELLPQLKLINNTASGLEWLLELTAVVKQPIYLNQAQHLPAGIELRSNVHLLHALVPLVIEGVALLVWPLPKAAYRIPIFMFGLFLAIPLLLVTLPALLLGPLEMAFQDIALSGQAPRPAPLFMRWMLFCEMGGLWLLGIVAAWICVQMQYLMRDRPVVVTDCN
jgi:hypothetical protein